MLEYFGEKIRLLNPAVREKLAATLLADRFDSVKEELKQLGVEMINSGFRESDDNFVSIVELNFNKANAEVVRKTLDEAGIKEAEGHKTLEASWWQVVGRMIDRGMMDEQALLREYHSRKFILFRGKHIDSEDMRRLCTLDPITK